jgi:glucose-6-phosphate isomerase
MLYCPNEPRTSQQCEASGRLLFLKKVQQIMTSNQTEIQASLMAPLMARLTASAAEMREQHLRDLCSGTRDEFSLSLDDLSVDFTRQPVTSSIMQQLCQLAEISGLKDFQQQMMTGQAVNISENRPVLHCDLRAPARLHSDEWQQLSRFADTVRADEKIRHVINLGIGGSDLGGAMVLKALAHDCDGPDVYFAGNIDPAALGDVLKRCTPEHTRIIITSKSFTTAETLMNAAMARDWLIKAGVDADAAFIAVTAAPDKARAYGIEGDKIFSFSDGIGGRYSVWSAVGLPVMIAIGADKFSSFLGGAHAMDQHVMAAPFADNIPVIMGLLRVWHRRYFDRSSYAIIPYSERLSRLPAWAQQLEMESNGKRVSRHNEPLDAPAAPLIWGEAGTNAQHSFFQFLHQGVDEIPLDILLPLSPSNNADDPFWKAHHMTLVANAVAQAEALAFGTDNLDNPHQHFPGNRPSIVISWEKTTPYALGRLLALYEHVTIVSGFLFGVNSFDQWGVELGKARAIALEEALKTEGSFRDFSPAAAHLIKRARDIIG